MNFKPKICEKALIRQDQLFRIPYAARLNANHHVFPSLTYESVHLMRDMTGGNRPEKGPTYAHSPNLA